MKLVQELLHLAAQPGPAQSRRLFFRQAGKGVLAASAASALAACQASVAQTPGVGAAGYQLNTPVDTIAIKLRPHAAASEQPGTGAVPAPLAPDRRIGFAIVGLGSLALNQILPAFAKSKYAKPVALVSGSPDKAKKVADEYGIPATSVYSYQTFDELRHNPAVQVVYIVLPNSLHEEFVVRAAKAGKHVLCEKPMATSSASAQRMITACQKASVKLMIAYRIQYEPNNRQVMQWVRSQEYGRVRVFDAFNGQNSGDPGQWRLKKALSGGGSLPDIGLYNLNTIRFLLGEEPEMVVATTFSTPGDERFREVEEAVLFQLFFPSGAISNNTCSFGVHESRYYRCNADKGGFFGVINPFAYSGLQLEVSQKKNGQEWKSTPSLGPEKDQFALELDHMADCVIHNRRPYTPGEEGLQDQKLMEAIYESARTQRPVRLPRITQLDAFRGDPPR